jgi:hypothetical protein
MKRRKVNAIEFYITPFDPARGLLNPFPAQGIPLLGFLERDYLTLSQLKESLLLGFLEGLLNPFPAQGIPLSDFLAKNTTPGRAAAGNYDRPETTPAFQYLASSLSSCLSSFIILTIVLILTMVRTKQTPRRERSGKRGGWYCYCYCYCY